MREALLARTRYELEGDATRLDTALEALERARMLSGSRADSLLLYRIQRERDHIEQLRVGRR